LLYFFLGFGHQSLRGQLTKSLHFKVISLLNFGTTLILSFSGNGS